MSTIPNPLPASFLRGGTSKGIYLKETDLPPRSSIWDTIFLGIMGSPDAEYGRQLNGMGGGISSLSKICVVRPPSDTQRAQGIDVVYTFVQVGVRDSTIDISGNCGNLSSMIGVFALDEGICEPGHFDERAGTAVVRSFNTNTQKQVDTTFPVTSVNGRLVPVLDLPQTSIAGVPGKASQITLDFISPSGAGTGKLLPTGQPSDVILLNLANRTHHFRVSLVDATNPSVFITSKDLRVALNIPDNAPIDYAGTQLCNVIEELRQRGAECMGLDRSVQAQPKIAVLEPPSPEEASTGVDVVVHAFSMGVLHKAIPMTVGLCLGVAATIENTIAWSIVRNVRASAVEKKDGTQFVKIRHPGGVVDVGATIDHDGSVKSAKVVRTGRRLMKGHVWW